MRHRAHFTVTHAAQRGLFENCSRGGWVGRNITHRCDAELQALRDSRFNAARWRWGFHQVDDPIHKPRGWFAALNTAEFQVGVSIHQAGQDDSVAAVDDGCIGHLIFERLDCADGGDHPVAEMHRAFAD